jgi:hypothetical protein
MGESDPVEQGVETWICPDCGAEVKVGARACPGCGPARRKRPRRQRKRRAWKQDPIHDGLDLPDGDFDYDDFIAREFGGKAGKGGKIAWYWWLTGLLLVAGFVAMLVTGPW